MPNINGFDPYTGAALIAEVPGLRARRKSLPNGARIPWYRASRATTTVFANDSGLIVQLQDPPFRWLLRAGEFYSIPPGMATSVYASDGSPLTFTVFQYGESLETKPAAPPKRDFVFDRTLPASTEGEPLPQKPSADFERYHQAYRRMDIFALLPQIRLIVQAHGPYECVPWHTHDNVTDRFFCSNGYARIATKEPDRTKLLAPGEVYEVPAGVPHFVSGADGQPCTLMVMQGVGAYNYKVYS